MSALMQFTEKECLKERFLQTRRHSVALTESLTSEDMQAQSMPDASPIKWHLAHTTWAFETFILKEFETNFEPFDTQYEYLFNSYYNAVGSQFPRPQRGLLTRPSIDTVNAYRKNVDTRMTTLIDIYQSKESNFQQSFYDRLLLMINHEQQHQELMVTDLKHLFSINPVKPNYQPQGVDERLLFSSIEESSMVLIDGGLHTIGHQNDFFYFDNEGPQHRYFLEPFKISTNLVSNGEFLQFIECGGYHNSVFWLSEAWQLIQESKTAHPLYWRVDNGQWHEFTLSGWQPIERNKPVKHLSYFEANAFAAWQDKRLPTEQEWEVAARSDAPLSNVFNQVWQWTSSSYSAYPNFKVSKGAIGEYNGKFMVNQYVLRGGSVMTPHGHIRASYRNFFYPTANWQYSGIRLAESC